MSVAIVLFYVLPALIFIAIPVTFVWLILRAIRRGNGELDERFKNAEANKPPMGRLGE
jgi:hypothetical protein